MTLDDPTVMAEPWPDQSRVTTAELLDEIRRAHAEADRWKACAVDWMRRCDELEGKLGEACDIAEKAMDQLLQD